MLITEYLDLSAPIELTPEEEKQLDELDNRPIAFDEDSMPISYDYMKRILAEKHKTT